MHIQVAAPLLLVDITWSSARDLSPESPDLDFSLAGEELIKLLAFFDAAPLLLVNVTHGIKTHTHSLPRSIRQFTTASNEAMIARVKNPWTSPFSLVTMA